MRQIAIFVLICLYLTFSASAQDTVQPVIMVGYSGDVVAITDDQTQTLYTGGRFAELHLSPDGTQIAVLSEALFLRDETDLEPGDYPDDVVVIDIASGEITPLVYHEDDTDLYEGTLVFNGDWIGNVHTDRAWDDVNSISGGVMEHSLAWSPDSLHIAQIQTVVTGGKYPGETRLVVFDVQTGEFSEIAALNSLDGYAVFWFEEGIVLYTHTEEPNQRTITVYTLDGEVLKTWELDRFSLSHENPVRYEGKDYLAFPMWNLFDLETGEFFEVKGTLALVSANAPETSLVVEACADRNAMEVTWDVYTPEGEKLTSIARAKSFTLSPDGQQVLYIAHDERTVMRTDAQDTEVRPVTQGLQAEQVIWGNAVYTITPVGMEDCRRTPRG